MANGFDRRPASTINREDGTIPINIESIACLLVHAIRVPQVFEAARATIYPEDLGGRERPDEEPYKYVWAACLDLFRINGELPNETLLSSHAETLIRSVPFMPDVDQLSEVTSGLIEALYEIPDTDFVPLYALKICKGLGDRKITDRLRNKIQEAEALGNSPDLETALEEATTQARMVRGFTSPTITEKPLLDMDGEFEDEPELPTPLPTGASYFDVNTSGGIRNGEVYTLIGPTGGGKSLAAIQALVSRARMMEAEGMAPELRNFYFSFESSYQEVATRIISCAGYVNFDDCPTSKAKFNALSTEGNLKPYERQLYADGILHAPPGQPLPGERERLRRVQSILSARVTLEDFNNNRDTGSRGNGGISEIAATLRHHQNNGRHPHFVVIDYAGACVRNNLLSRGLDPSEKQNAELGYFLDRVIQEICTEFNCAALVLHQMNGDMNGKPAGAMYHHSQAQWNKSFSERAWYAHVLGNLQKNEKCVTFSTTKTRLGPPAPTRILKQLGHIGILHDVSDQYEIDGGRIVLRDHLGLFGEQRARAEDEEIDLGWAP